MDDGQEFRSKDVLESCGIKKDAVYIGSYGKDTHLSGDPTKVVISRGVPIKKALEDEVLIAGLMKVKIFHTKMVIL